MTLMSRALPLAVFSCLAMLGTACLMGGGSEQTPTPVTTPLVTPQANVQAARTVGLATATATPWPTVLPARPLDTSYVVQSGDNPTLIAEYANVPAAQRDAWITEMLALNNTDAHSLQIGQKLVLPPLDNGTLPTVAQHETTNDATDGNQPAPPANIVIAQPIPQGTPTPKPATGLNGVPIAPTVPFVAFITPTATPTPTATATPRVTPTPTPKPTIAAGERAWLTSSEETAVYYYCDLDTGWQDIPADKLLAFNSEQQLLAVWGRFRTKAPNSVC